MFAKMGTTNIPKDFERIMQHWWIWHINFCHTDKKQNVKMFGFTRWFKYDRDCLQVYTVPVIFEPPCISPISTRLCRKLKSLIIKKNGMITSCQFQNNFNKRSFRNSGMKAARTIFPLDKVQLHLWYYPDRRISAKKPLSGTALKKPGTEITCHWRWAPYSLSVLCHLESRSQIHDNKLPTVTGTEDLWRYFGFISCFISYFT